jgi:hypothetical protein
MIVRSLTNHKVYIIAPKSILLQACVHIHRDAVHIRIFYSTFFINYKYIFFYLIHIVHYKHFFLTIGFSSSKFFGIKQRI